MKRSTHAMITAAAALGEKTTSNHSCLRAALLAVCLTASFAPAANAQRIGERNSATIVQDGGANTAGILQDGQGNDAALGQAGRNNTGTIVQRGDNNSGCLYQLGRGLDGSITQSGDNQSTAWLQTRAGLRPIRIEVCRAQVNGGRSRDSYRNARVRVPPSAYR